MAKTKSKLAHALIILALHTSLVPPRNTEVEGPYTVVISQVEIIFHLRSLSHSKYMDSEDSEDSNESIVHSTVQ